MYNPRLRYTLMMLAVLIILWAVEFAFRRFNLTILYPTGRGVLPRTPMDLLQTYNIFWTPTTDEELRNRLEDRLHALEWRGVRDWELGRVRYDADRWRRQAAELRRQAASRRPDPNSLPPGGV